MDTLVSPRDARPDPTATTAVPSPRRHPRPTRGVLAREPQPRGRFAPPVKRAESFYRRNRFVPDGLAVSAGPSWFSRPTLRMHRT